MLADVNWVYSSPLALGGISGAAVNVPADMSQLTCATAASDRERRKALACFSRV